jgi:hypothetical protein
MSNDAAWLKSITRFLIGPVRGSRAVVAKLLGVSNPEVTYWCEDRYNRFIPIDHLYELDAQRGDLFLKAWAERRGYQLTQAERVAPEAADMSSLAGDIAMLAGSTAHEIIERGKDGEYCVNDARAIRDCIGSLSNKMNTVTEALP